jgi:hypothetical protein
MLPSSRSFENENVNVNENENVNVNDIIVYKTKIANKI